MALPPLAVSCSQPNSCWRGSFEPFGGCSACILLLCLVPHLHPHNCGAGLPVSGSWETLTPCARHPGTPHRPMPYPPAAAAGRAAARLAGCPASHLSCWQHALAPDQEALLTICSLLGSAVLELSGACSAAALTPAAAQQPHLLCSPPQECPTLHLCTLQRDLGWLTHSLQHPQPHDMVASAPAVPSVGFPAGAPHQVHFHTKCIRQVSCMAHPQPMPHSLHVLSGCCCCCRRASTPTWVAFAYALRAAGCALAVPVVVQHFLRVAVTYALCCNCF